MYMVDEPVDRQDGNVDDGGGKDNAEGNECHCTNTSRSHCPSPHVGKRDMLDTSGAGTATKQQMIESNRLSTFPNILFLALRLEWRKIAQYDNEADIHTRTEDRKYRTKLH